MADRSRAIAHLSLEDEAERERERRDREELERLVRDAEKQMEVDAENRADFARRMAALEDPNNFQQ